jgi:hypothetical protein
MNPYTPKWTPILGVGILMESQIFKEVFQGTKLINQKVPYTIKKFLKLDV